MVFVFLSRMLSEAKVCKPRVVSGKDDDEDSYESYEEVHVPAIRAIALNSFAHCRKRVRKRPVLSLQ